MSPPLRSPLHLEVQPLLLSAFGREPGQGQWLEGRVLHSPGPVGEAGPVARATRGLCLSLKIPPDLSDSLDLAREGLTDSVLRPASAPSWSCVLLCESHQRGGSHSQNLSFLTPGGENEPPRPQDPEGGRVVQVSQRPWHAHWPCLLEGYAVFPGGRG